MPQATPNPPANPPNPPNPHASYDATAAIDHTVFRTWFTPENRAVTRDDIQNLLDVGTPLANLTTILGNRGLSASEIEKVVTDLPSYH